MLADRMLGLPTQATAELERSLKEFVSARDLPLYRIMSFQLGWEDENGEPVMASPPERLYGLVAMATAQAVSGDYRPAVEYSVSLELLNNFWQMHGDVEDGNTERSGRPSVWWAWGPAQAINAGDGMHAMARLSLFRLREIGIPPERVAAAVRALDEATLRLCEGEYLDISYQERLTVTVDSYLEMAHSRNGSLLGCAAQLGALASLGETSEIPARLVEFGEKLGTARQISADLNALWREGDRDQVQQGRLIAKKKSLPVVHAMNHADPGTKRKLGELYMQRVLDPAALGDVAALLETSGSKDFTIKTLDDLLSQADIALESSGLPVDGVNLLKEAARAVATLET